MMSMADHRLPQNHLSLSQKPSVQVQLASVATSNSHPTLFSASADHVDVVMADHRHAHAHMRLNTNIHDHGGYDHSIAAATAASNYNYVTELSNNNSMVVVSARSQSSNNNSSSSNTESELLLSANNNWGGGGGGGGGLSLVGSPGTHLLGINHNSNTTNNSNFIVRMMSNDKEQPEEEEEAEVEAASSSESSRRSHHHLVSGDGNSSHGGDDKDGVGDEEELGGGRCSSSWLQLGLGGSTHTNTSHQQPGALAEDESTATAHDDDHEMRFVGMGATASTCCSSLANSAPTTGILFSHHQLDLHLGPCSASASASACAAASPSNQHQLTTTFLPSPPYYYNYNYNYQNQINHHHMIMGMGMGMGSSSSSTPSQLLSSSNIHHQKTNCNPYSTNANMFQLLSPNSSSLKSGNFTVIDPPPRRPHSGIWFTLQPSLHQAREPFLPQLSKSFLRIKDGRMTVRLVMKYVANKLGLDSESQVEIKCRGQQLVPFLTLQHVRDRIWSQRDVDDSTSLLIPNSSTSTSTSPHVMLLHYGRIGGPWGGPTTSSSMYT